VADEHAVIGEARGRHVHVEGEPFVHADVLVALEYEQVSHRHMAFLKRGLLFPDGVSSLTKGIHSEQHVLLDCILPLNSKFLTDLVLALLNSVLFVEVEYLALFFILFWFAIGILIVFCLVVLCPLELD